MTENRIKHKLQVVKIGLEVRAAGKVARGLEWQMVRTRGVQEESVPHDISGQKRQAVTA